MKNFSIIENVLPKPYWSALRERFLDEDLAWYYSEEISVKAGTANPFTGNPEIMGSCGFSHPLLVKDHFTSPHWEAVQPLLYFMADKSNYSKLQRSFDVLRAKANLQTQVNGSTPDNFNMPHIDPVHFQNKATNWIFLYYLVDSDGDTIIFNETAAGGCPSRLTIRERVTPRANTGILFRDDIFHASSNPIRSRRRVNLNFNLIAG